MKNNYTLASMALFSKLCDDHKDIYSLIFEFIKNAVSIEKKSSISSVELTDLINKHYNFDIPESVIKASLKNHSGSELFSFDKNIYNFNLLLLDNQEKLDKDYCELKSRYDLIFKGLVEFVENSLKKDLNDESKIGLMDSFYKYLLDNNYSTYYSDLISSYIIHLDVGMQELLNSIKEGIMVYEGVIYTPNLESLGKWNDKIIFYLSTEHLYHFTGLNGDLYNKLFMDFMGLVKDINVKSNLIELRYFEETKNEIEIFFINIERQVENRNFIPKNQAQYNLLKECKNRSDVVAKKNNFFKVLKSNGIKEDNNDSYWMEENQQYNIIGRDTLVNILKDKSLSDKEDECNKLLQQINKVSILRKGLKEKSFNKAKVIFVSDNRTVFDILSKDFIKYDEQFRYAVNLDYVINRLWFSLNKGLGKNSDKAASFDVVIRAKLAFSNIALQKVHEKFNEFKIKYKDITEEESASLLCDFKKFDNMARNVSVDNVDEIWDFIATDTMAFAQREKASIAKKTSDFKEAINELIIIKKQDFLRKNSVIKKEERKTNVLLKLKILFILFFYILIFLLMVYLFDMLMMKGDTILAIVFYVINLIIIFFPVFKNCFKKINKIIVTKKKQSIAKYKKNLSEDFLAIEKQKENIKSLDKI